MVKIVDIVGIVGIVGKHIGEWVKHYTNYSYSMKNSENQTLNTIFPLYQLFLPIFMGCYIIIIDCIKSG